MESHTKQDIGARIEIQRELVSINDILLKIRAELEAINGLLKENGELPIAVHQANKTLTAIAEAHGININDIINTNGNDSKLQMKLPDFLTSAAFTEKLQSLMYDEVLESNIP